MVPYKQRRHSRVVALTVAPAKFVPLTLQTTLTLHDAPGTPGPFHCSKDLANSPRSSSYTHRAPLCSRIECDDVSHRLMCGGLSS